MAADTLSSSNGSACVALEPRNEEQQGRPHPFGFQVSIDANLGTDSNAIYQKMREQEEGDYIYNPSASYLAYRRMLVDWICEVGEDNCRFDPSTVHTAIAYMDTILQRNAFETEQLQILGIVCLLAAGKYEEAEDRVPPVSILNEIAGTNFTKRSVNQMEILLLEKLQWRLSIVTPLHFLGLMLRQGIVFESDLLRDKPVIPKAVRYVGRYTKFFCDLCAQEHSFNQYKPSLKAAAAAVASRRAIFLTPMWVPELEPVLRYAYEEITPVLEHMWIHYRENFPKECSAVDVKYMDDLSSAADAHMEKIAAVSGRKRSPSCALGE